MECILECAEGKRCGFDQLRRPACYTDCKDPACADYGECKQVFGNDFKCECNADAFFNTATESCTKCTGHCSNSMRCGAIAGGIEGRCFPACEYSCSNSGYCGYQLPGNVFACICPEGYKNDCMKCDKGYQAYEYYCYKMDCGDAGSGYDQNQCTNRGICSIAVVEEGKYVCKCNQGFDYKSYCLTCLPDFVYQQDVCYCGTGKQVAVLNGVDVCVTSTCIAYTGYVCNGKGTCSAWQEGDHIEMECECRSNRNPADNCVSCLPNYYEYPPTGECLPNNCGEADCNGNGTCVSSNTGKNCVCDKNFNVHTQCRDCTEDYKLKKGVCVKGANLNLIIPLTVVCVVVVMAAVAAGVWFTVKRRQASHLDDALLDYMTIADQGYLNPLSKGLQLYI